MTEGVAVMIRNAGKYLMIKRGKQPLKDYWAPVHGTIENSDSGRIEAAKREAREEVGLEVELTGDDFLAETRADDSTEKLYWCLTEDYTGSVEPDNREVADFEWLRLEEAMEKRLMPATRKFLQEYGEEL